MDMSQIDKYEKLGLNIAYYRHMRKMTQEQLSEKADIDRTHLSNIELANSAASLDVIFHLSDGSRGISRLLRIIDICKYKRFNIPIPAQDIVPHICALFFCHISRHDLKGTCMISVN